MSNMGKLKRKLKKAVGDCGNFLDIQPPVLKLFHICKKKPTNIWKSPLFFPVSHSFCQHATRWQRQWMYLLVESCRCSSDRILACCTGCRGLECVPLTKWYFKPIGNMNWWSLTVNGTFDFPVMHMTFWPRVSNGKC